MELLLQGSMKKGGIIEYFLWLNFKIYEVTFDNYSVSPFFPYIFFSYIHETGLNANFCGIF